MSPLVVELEGCRVELVELEPFYYGATIDGVRAPLRVRCETWTTVMLSGQDDRAEKRTEGMRVGIGTPFSNGVDFVAWLLSAPSRVVGDGVCFERPHLPPGGVSISTRATVQVRDGTVELDIFQHYRDENAY